MNLLKLGSSILMHSFKTSSDSTSTSLLNMYGQLPWLQHVQDSIYPQEVLKTEVTYLSHSSLNFLLHFMMVWLSYIYCPCSHKASYLHTRSSRQVSLQVFPKCWRCHSNSSNVGLTEKRHNLVFLMKTRRQPSLCTPLSSGLEINGVPYVLGLGRAGV